MLSVVTWKWRNKVGWIDYTHDNVNRLKNQVKRYAGVPHEFFCITDDRCGLDKDIHYVPIKEVDGPIPIYSDSGKFLRSCYRRLRLFDPAMEKWFGKRILQLDVDMVIVDYLSHMLTRTEPFIIWRSFSHGKRRNFALNTSIILMDAGAKEEIWRKFSRNPEQVAKNAKYDGWAGTDQAVIGHLTYHNDHKPPTFTKEDGIYSFRDDPVECQGNELAAGVRVISFHDRFNPADPKLHKQCKWLKDAWDAADSPVFPVGKSIPLGACEQTPQHVEAEPIAVV